jgi:hypothetical protein
MSGRSDRGRPESDELLAQGRLSGPARDRILDAALAASRPAARPVWQRVLVWAAPLTVAAVVLFMAFRPSEFRPRGGAGAVLDVGCRDGTLAACPAGTTLLFRVSAAPAGGFLAAFALRDGSREPIWYFPTAAGDSPKVSPDPETQTLAQGVRLGSEHVPGRYRIHLVLTRRALTRDQALAPPRDAVLAESDVSLEVTP